MNQLRIEAVAYSWPALAEPLFRELTVPPDDRIALQGPNGAGKSTLIRRLLGELIGRDQVLSIPQEIDESGARRLVARVRESDAATLGRVISTISRLGSDPGRLGN